MPAEIPEEVRRFDYNGCLLVETLLPSALSYGPPKFERWEIFRTEPDGSRSFVGYENSEQFAKLVVDHIVHRKERPSS